MSRHNKKQQKNPSLKERLGKHWDNRNWDMFVVVFLRDKDASMRTIWANRWSDALYNSLTKALFVDKNQANIETTLELILAERNERGVPASLTDCAGVASDFLNARKNLHLKELSPLIEEASLPIAYAKLRKGLLSFISASNTPKAKKGGAAALPEKFALQYAKLEHAKTAAPFITWLKSAEQLERAAMGKENKRVFRAVHAIAGLIRELFRTGKGENMLRDPDALFDTELFLSIPPGQTHPTVRVLWEFFCRAGERKYGAEWGEAGRVSQLSFMDEEGRSTLSTQYNRLMKSEFERMDVVLLKIIRGSQAWTEQELYILNASFVNAFSIFEHMDKSFVTEFFEAFNTLTRLGRKWRPAAPWVKIVRDSFEKLLHIYPISLITSVITQIPYDVVSPYSLVILSLKYAKQLNAIEKIVPERLPLHLDEEDQEMLKVYLLKSLPTIEMLQILNALIGRAEYISILRRLVCKVIRENAEDASMGKPQSHQIWTKLNSRGLMEELAISLPPDSFEGCFCRLCSGMPLHRISNDPSKIEAFLAALPPATEIERYVDYFMVLVLTWPDIDPKFILSLFEKSFLFLNAGNQTRFCWTGYDLEDLAELIVNMPNKSDREAVALGVLRLISTHGGKRGGSPVKKAIVILKRLVDEKQLKNIKETSSSGRTKKHIQNTASQTCLPFDDM